MRKMIIGMALLSCLIVGLFTLALLSSRPAYAQQTTQSVWILIATAGSGSSPVVVGKFRDQQECSTVAEQIYAKSKAKNGMLTVSGVCVQASIIP